MKTLKTIAMTVVAMLSLASCTSTYYYSQVTPYNDYFQKHETGDYLFENDSIRIAYSFNGEDAPIRINVYNKTEKPLYVDWSKSALILKDEAYPYVGEGKIALTTQSTGTVYPRYGFFPETIATSGEASGTISMSSNVSFTPPKTMTTKETLRITPRFNDVFQKERAEKRTLASQDGSLYPSSHARYNEEDSPLKFSSYITYVHEGEQPKSLRSDFYISRVIKTKLAPKWLGPELAGKGDFFYLQQHPNNTGWEVLGTTALIAGSVIIEAKTNNNSNDHYHRR